MSKPPPSPARTIGIAILVIGSVVALIAIVVVCGGLWFGLFRPFLRQAQLSAQRDVAGATLKGIGNAFHAYASTSGGQFPEARVDLATRLAAWVPDPSILVAPGGTPGRVGGPYWFYYVPNRTTKSKETDILLYQIPANSDGTGIQVVYVSGYVTFVTPDKYPTTIDAITLDDGTPWTPHVPGWVPPK